MSEVDRLMDLATGPAKPAVQFDSYSVWADSQSDDADVSAFHTGYADYLREEHIKAKAYDSAVEQDILKGMYGSLVKDGRLQEGDLEGFEKLNAAPEMGFDRRADFFLSSVEFDKDENSDYRKVQRYANHRDQIARGELKIMGEVSEDQTNLLEQRRLEAEDVMSRHGDDDLRRLAVKNGELAFASVLNDKGQRVVIAGDRALETDLLTGLKQSKTGGVTLSDALGAQAELETPEGFSLPRFQLRRVHEAATGLEELVKQDAFLQTQVAGHAQKMAKMEYDDGDKLSWGMDQFGQTATDIFGRLLGIAGTEENKIEREAQQRAEQTDVRQVVRSLVKRLNASGESDFTQEEVMKAYTQVVLNDATASGRFEFHDGDDEVGKNIRTFGYGAPSVHPAAMANEDTFNKMLAARDDISDSVKDNLRANRKAYLTDSFDDTSNLLGRSGVADDWHEALIEGRRQGKKNYEILDGFLADEKNFSAFSERAKGVAWSLWDAGAQLVAAVPAAMGADWAQDTLVASAQRNSDRRQVAQLFGEDFGFGQDIAETIAPMLTDVAATAALAAVTAKAGGVGAVAYQAGKQGARITAKGIVKGLTTSAFRNVGEKGAKDAAESLVVQGLIKESIKDTSGKGSMAAIKAYNGLLAQKIAKHSTLPAIFVPAATRSGGATYGSVYNTLSQDPSLSEEEIHDRALGAALGAGALTGLITATFSAFGRGGVEDALLKGLNYKQAKALIGSLSNTSGISNATFKEVVTAQAKATLKNFKLATAYGIIDDAKDEALEEGLDQLFNGFIEDAALHQNTPMVERFQQSMYAAALGGTMGAGATGIRKIAGSIAPDTYEKAAQARQLQDQFVTDVTARLATTDSPMTAQAVAALLTSKARKRGKAAATPQKPDAAPDQDEEQLELGLDVEPTADGAPATPTGQPRPTLAAVDARLVAIERELGPRTRLVGDSSNPDTMVSQDIRIPTSEESQLLELRKEIADREAPSLPTKEVEDAVAERMLQVATLMIEPASGRKNKKRSRRQQRQIQRLEDEIAFMQENNTTDIPAEIPKRAPVEQPAPPAPTQEQLELDLNTEETATPKQIIERLEALPAEDARARVLLAIDDMEGPRLFDRRIAMSILSTSKTGRTAPFNSLFPPNVTGAAEAAGADPQQAALNNAKHVDFFLPDQEEDLDPAPKRIGYVFPKDSERRKSFAVGKKVELDLKPFKEGDTAQEEELAEALSAVQLAQQGYPVRFGSGIKYGTIVDNKRMKSKSDFVANAVYTYYPTIEADASQISETRASTRQRTYFDPAQNKTVTGRIKMPLDADGRGIFTNDPVVVAEMLAHNIPVRAPNGTKNINPAIKPYIKRGYVTDVRMPSKDGSMLESAITRVDAPTDLRPNNNQFENIAKVQFRGLPPVENELNELLMAHSELGAERNMSDKIGQLFSSKNFKMDSEFADYTVQSTATEFALTSHLYELHKYFMDSRRRRTLVDSPKGKTINPSSRKRAIAELRSRLSGDPELSEMAEILSPMLRLKESAKPTHTEVVVQFIEDFVLNNPDFDGGVMPTFDSIFERTFNRYAQQQRERGVNERNKALVSIDTEEVGTNVIDTQQLRDGTLDVGGIDPAEQIDEGAFLNTVTNVIDTAIDSVDTDPMLRDALNDLALQSIYTNPDSGTVSHVQRMNTRDLMARIGTWMSAGDHATRPAALEFTALLESGGFRSGIELRNALRLTSMFGRIDGDASANPDVISEVRHQLSESLGQPVTEARARNFVRSMDGAMRRRLSRAVIGKISDADALEQNTIEAERLGLKSGDPSSVIAALEQISKRSKNKSHRLVAELLLEDKIFIQKVGFSMGQSNADIAGEYVRHTDGKHSVFLNMQKSNGIDLENVLLEEYVHAFMSDTLAKPDELLNSRQQTARRRLEGLYQIAQREYRRVADSNSADTNAVLEAGLENMDEFVANFLLDPDFQKFIKTLDTPVGQRGFFARILDAMVAMFRKISPKENALYASALKDVVDLSKSTMRSSAVPFKQQAASAVHEASNRIQEAGRVMTLRTSVMSAPETNAEASLRETYEPQTDEEVNAAERANQNNRSPILSVAAVRLANGQITIEDYARAVDAIDPFVVKGVEKTPSESSIRKYISTAKVDKVGVKVDPETLVEVRIDIPTYTKSVKDGNAVYAVTLHEPVSSTATRVGTPLSYVPMAHLTNVDMRTRAISGKGGAIRIAAGQGKTPLATVAGKLVSTSTIPKDISEYTEVSYNPIRSSEFRDVSNRRVVIGGDEAVSIGSRVYVKNPRYGSEPSGYIDSLTPEADIRYTSIPEAGSTQLISDSQKDLTTEQQQAEFEEVVGFLRERLPYGVQFKHDPNMPAAMGADGDFILINPKILMRGLESFDRLGKRKMVDIMLHEEIGHEASFGALTQAEIDGLVDSLSDEQYAEIASEYYRFNPDQQQQALANLQSEDPAVVAEEKFRLAEEKLRMRLQEITRGYTTEEDAEFWRSKPSLLAILKRYIGGVINKWAANRRLNGASGTMDAALTKVIGEMQAIELGFSRQKLSQTFNPNLPAESVEAYMRALNADPLGDIEDYTNAANQVALFAATAIDSKAFNRIMNYAGLNMELARRTKKRDIDVESMTDEERDAFMEEEQMALEMELAGAPIDLDDLDPELNQFMATDDEIFGVDSDLDSDVVFGEKIKEVFEAVNVGADYALEVKTDQGEVDIILKGDEGQEINSVDLYLQGNGVIKIGEMKSAEEIGRARIGSSFAETLLTTLIVNNQELGIRRITTTAGGSSSDVRTSRAYKEIINRFVAPNVNQEDSPSVKMSGMESLAPRNLSMNGYYSWPAYGFDMVKSPTSNPDTAIFDPMYFKTVESSIRNAVSDVGDNLDLYGSTVKDGEPADDAKGLTLKYVSGLTNEEIVQTLLKEAKAELKELRSLVTRPDGQIDFFYGLHDENIPRATRNRVAYLWQMYGVQTEVEMSLSRYSANLAAFLQRKFSSLIAVKQIPELTAIVDEFETNRRKLKKETDSESLPEAYQDLQDEYNARVINEGLLDFPVFTSIGQNAGNSSSLDGVDFGNVVQLLEMPMYEYQAYKAPKGWLSRLFMGDVGRPVKQLIDQREAFKRASTRLVKQYKEKMDKLIVEAYGDPSNTDWDLIAQAQGYVDGGLLNEDTIQQFDDEHMARLDRINQNDQLTPREKQIMRDSSRAKRDKSIENAEELALKQAQRASDAALTKLGQRSSELAAHIKSMRRDLIQPIQQKMKDAGLTDEISAKIDRTGGIYITRAYRMFNDPTFAERVRTDPQYADLRDRAMKFFEDELYKNMYNSTYSQTYDKLVDQGMDAGLAKAKAEDKATKKAKKAVKKAYDKAGYGHTAGSAALEAFLDKYSERTGVSPQSANGLKVLEDNLKKRKDVPKVIRELLGEYGPQEGTDLIVRTFSTVANVAAQQTFLNNVAEVGKQQGFLVDQATYEAARDQYEDYVPLRRGNSTNPNDPLNNLYGPRDMVEAMQDTLNPSFTVDHNSTSEKAVRGLSVVAQKLTGQAMAMKTLGSVGFFLRNALGNFLFFGPAQGFFRVDKMMGRSLMFNRTSLDEKGQRLTDAQVQEYLTELTGLNIVGDELHAGLLRQLLNGEIDPDSALAKINKAIDEIPVIGKTKKGAATLQKKLADLSAAIDGRYKIAYYENELSMLLEAKRRYPKSDIGRMSEYDLKRMAAEKVLMTAQSLSQAPPLAQSLTKSGFGMVFAPFIRFKMEVPRIVINTYKLAARERKSNNPMVRARGTRRFFAMTGVLGGFSAAVPATLAALSGVGGEEDEALRKSMPEYLRGHTFFYLRDDKGNLRSVNMTYLNPFSLLVDPFLRSLPKLAKGDISDAVGQFTKGMVFDTYLDDQILAGSMMDVLKNRNSTTDDPIWVEGVDGLGASLLKSATYLYENSYQPRLLKDMIDAKNATGGDYEGFSNSPLGQLLDGAYPVKVHEVDLQKQYRRFIYSHLDRMSAVNKQKYELYSKESFDPDKIDSIYQRELDGKRALNQEMLRIARGFEGLGLLAKDQFRMLKSRGVGGNRARLMFHGIMDRPEINKQYAKGLVERGYAARLNEVVKARNKRARYLHIEDPD